MPKIKPEHVELHRAFSEKIDALVRKEIAAIFDSSGDRKTRPRLGDLGHVLYSVLGVPEDMVYSMRAVVHAFIVQMLQKRGKAIIPGVGVFSVRSRRLGKLGPLLASARKRGCNVVYDEGATALPRRVRVVTFRPNVKLDAAIKASDSPVAFKPAGRTRAVK